MCYMFGRGLEAVDYEARGEACEGSRQKSLESSASQSSFIIG